MQILYQGFQLMSIPIRYICPQQSEIDPKKQGNFVMTLGHFQKQAVQWHKKGLFTGAVSYQIDPVEF